MPTPSTFSAITSAPGSSGSLTSGHTFAAGGTTLVPQMSSSSSSSSFSSASSASSESSSSDSWFSSVSTASSLSSESSSSDSSFSSASSASSLSSESSSSDSSFSSFSSVSSPSSESSSSDSSFSSPSSQSHDSSSSSDSSFSSASSLSSASSQSSESSSSDSSFSSASSRSSASSDSEESDGGPVNRDVISGANYLSIARSYAAARDHLSNVEQFVFEPVDLIVHFDEILPTVDLIGEFYSCYLATTQWVSNTTTMLNAVRALQQHVFSRSGYGSVQTYIEREIMTEGSANGIPERWAALSKEAGFNIDAVIDPATTESSSSSSE